MVSAGADAGRICPVNETGTGRRARFRRYFDKQTGETFALLELTPAIKTEIVPMNTLHSYALFIRPSLLQGVPTATGPHTFSGNRSRPDRERVLKLKTVGD